MDLMRDPVIDANGRAFKRRSIECVIEDRPDISPLTPAIYPNVDVRLTPNFAVHSMIDARNEAAGETVCAPVW
jgi:hypothetical protein